MPSGHYTSLSARGPMGDLLWYTADGTWSADPADKYIFNQTQFANHTAIQNLPAGYHTTVNFENVPLPPPPQDSDPGCWTPVVPDDC